MAQTTTAEDAVQQPAALQTAVQQPPVILPVENITLDEFCTRISKTDKRVELIGAFFKMETVAGRTTAIESDFAARLAAFATKPV